MRVRPAVIKLVSIVILFITVGTAFVILKNNKMLPEKEPIDIIQPQANIQPSVTPVTIDTPNPEPELQTPQVQPTPNVAPATPTATNQSQNTGLSKLLETGKRN